MTIRNLSYKLFFRPVNAAFYRQPLKSGRFENFADAFMNRLDGFKPVALMSKDTASLTQAEPIVNNNPENGKIGRKFINWVRSKSKDYATRTDILGFSGSVTKIYKDIATKKPLYKVHANKDFTFETVYKQGKAQFISKTDKNKMFLDLPDAYTVYERQPSGKLEKIFTGTNSGQFQVMRISQGKDPHPFSNNAEDIWYGIAR